MKNEPKYFPFDLADIPASTEAFFTELSQNQQIPAEPASLILMTQVTNGLPDITNEELGEIWRTLYATHLMPSLEYRLRKKNYQ